MLGPVGTSATEYVGYVRGLIDYRRRHPGEDLLSDLIAINASVDIVMGEVDR